jgi:hypothetical protein
MKFSYVFCVALIVLCALPCSAKSKNTIDPALQNTYDHFVGTWIGTDKFYKYGTVQSISIKLIVTESKKRNSLRFDYYHDKEDMKLYDNPNAPNHTVRFVTLDPQDERVTFRWEGLSSEHYNSIGLKTMVATGYGSITFSDQKDPRHVRSRCALSLSPDVLAYKWESSKDGSSFEPMGNFTFTRVGTMQ